MKKPIPKISDSLQIRSTQQEIHHKLSPELSLDIWKKLPISNWNISIIADMIADIITEETI